MPNPKDIQNSRDVIKADLEHILDNLKSEFSEMSGKRVLVTGGAGFLGYYLIQSVLYWNNRNQHDGPIELVVYDNFMRGIPFWLKELSGNPNLKVHRHDVVDPLPADMGHFDYIIHGASIASPTYYRKHPIKTMDANVNGLRLLLDYCLTQKQAGKSINGFLYFSTSEIYGDPLPGDIPTPETYRGNVSCVGPRACYDESKRFGETLCVNFSREYDLPIKIARPFNNYGPGLKITDRRALPDFARNVFAGEDIVMLSDGSPTRTFCYIADAVIGYYKVLVCGHKGEAYNIGHDYPEISIKNLAVDVVRQSQVLFAYRGQLIFKVSEDVDYLTDNPNRRCPNINKAKDHLNYNPMIDFDEGIKRSLLWYADNLVAEDA